MPNVSKRPADADKLDPQEQLKKLREALLRDAAARESDGEDDAGGGTGTAANSKKDAAARRFAGVSGAGSTGGSAVGQQGSKKAFRKGREFLLLRAMNRRVRPVLLLLCLPRLRDKVRRERMSAAARFHCRRCPR